MNNREQLGLLLLLGVGVFYLWQRGTQAGQQFIYTATGEIIAVANQISQAGLDFIKRVETLSLDKYWDVSGYSIGYGHHFSQGEPVLDSITEQQADNYLAADTQSAQISVREHVSVPLTQNQFDALTSFVYNEGATHFYSSTLLKVLNAGDYNGAAAQFDKWIYANGQVLDALIDRRAAEKALFLSA